MSESNLEDRAAIHDLFTRYCCALDNGEVEAVVDCFTVDAILKSPVIARLFNAAGWAEVSPRCNTGWAK
jgi:hypothetical protein